MNNDVKTGVYTYNGEDIAFSFRTSLSAYDRIKFVNSVTNLIVGDNYNYAIKDLVFDFYIIDAFTDVDTSVVFDAPDAISAMEEFIESTNIVDIVIANALPGIIENLDKCVALNIEYKTGIHPNLISDSISSLLNTIERKVDEIDIGDMMELAKSMSGIAGELTPEKMLDAYAKTDIFKKNWDNANEHKKNIDSKQDGQNINNVFELVDGKADSENLLPVVE